MDQQTKHDLKQDHFITTTGHGLEWASENRRSVLITSAILLGVIVLAVVFALIANRRSEAASVGFGEAMQVYQAPLVTPGQPPLPGIKMYASAKERAQTANALFRKVADTYGSTADGKNARYFVGLTDEEAGQNQAAESTLKTVAAGWDKDLASLAKLALADLYRQTGRDAQAVDLYKDLTNKPTNAVSAGLAQIQLAELYTAEGKVDEAHRIYAQLKDHDAKGVAGVLAAQKLNPTAAAAAPPQL